MKEHTFKLTNKKLQIFLDIFVSVIPKMCGIFRFWAITVLLLLTTTSCHPVASPPVSTSQKGIFTLPQIPFPAHVHYAPTTLRPNHLSQQRQDDLVRSSYNHWKNRYLVRVSTPNGRYHRYRVSAGETKRHRSYSEGQGYGMLLVAYMAGYDPMAQDIFDGLWLFAANHSSRINKNFMAYQVPINKMDRNSAFDGDCDIAMALILADSQWGSGGHINYRREALSLIKALAQKVIGFDSKLPMLGDWVKQNGTRYNQYTLRSSDMMVSHFKTFYQVTGDREWLKVIERCQQLIDQMQARYSPKTGLLPDFIVGSGGKEPNYKPAISQFLESIHDGDYFYNATRVPWRIGLDALLNSDPVSLRQVKRIGFWIVKKSDGNPANIGPGYNLKGKRLTNENYVSKAFIAPFGVAVMATGDHQTFINHTFDLCVKLRQDYYEDTIALLCLLLMTGNCWLPG